MMKRKSGLEKPQTLHALLPGAKINMRKGRKICVKVGVSRETVIFNVGGTRFETFRSTLYSQPNSPFADEAFLKRHYIEDRKEYFFDRDHDMFKAVLGYLRTGELHIPSCICGPAAREELQYWGVSDDIIEKCCWSNYNSWNATLEALKQLEKDRKGSMDENTTIMNPNTRWGRLKSRVWTVLNKPKSSLAARIYGYVSLLFSLISIINFVTETLPMFEYNSGIERSKMENRTKPDDVKTYLNSTEDNRDFIYVVSSHRVFFIIDVICLVFFSIEYGLRFCLTSNRQRFIRSLMGVLDLLAIVPDYIQFIVHAVHPDMLYNGDIHYISVLRVTRVFRIFRLIRHVPGLWILIYTLKSSISELILVVVFLMVGVVIFSSLIYFVDDRSTFTSIPHSFWWALVTMTTVGYGDMYPVTKLGYIIGSCTALSGVLMIGFSVPILVNNFIMFYKHLEFAMIEDRINENGKTKSDKDRI